MRSYLAGLGLLLLLGCAQANPSSGPDAPASPAQAATRVAVPAPGQPAPAPPASDHNGAPVDLAALYQKGPVLVYFYPKAGTPGCTAQACSLRDAYQKLTDAGLTVVGVSADDQARQKAFQEEHQLPFTLIPDPEKTVINAFGVDTGMTGLAGREAFLIKDGLVVWHDSSASTDQQAQDVLAQLGQGSTPEGATP